MPRNQFKHRRLSPEAVLDIKVRRRVTNRNRPSLEDLADDYKVDLSTISRAARGILHARRVVRDHSALKARIARDKYIVQLVQKVKEVHGQTAEMAVDTARDVCRKLEGHANIKSGKWPSPGVRRVQQILHKAGMVYKAKPKTTVFSAADVEKRWDFVRRMKAELKALKNRVGRRKTPFLFMDETWVYVTSPGTRRKMWCRRGEEAFPFVATKCSPGMKVLVVVWMAHDYLHVDLIREGQRVTADVIHRLMQRHVPFMQEHNLSLYMDNAAPHRAKKVRAYLDRKGIRVVGTPVRSPDLNPVEEANHTIKLRVARKFPTVENLRATVVQVIDEMRKSHADMKAINNHVASFHKKVEAVWEKRGAPMKGRRLRAV